MPVTKPIHFFYALESFNGADSLKALESRVIFGDVLGASLLVELRYKEKITSIIVILEEQLPFICYICQRLASDVSDCKEL